MALSGASLQLPPLSPWWAVAAYGGLGLVLERQRLLAQVRSLTVHCRDGAGGAGGTDSGGTGAGDMMLPWAGAWHRSQKTYLVTVHLNEDTLLSELVKRLTIPGTTLVSLTHHFRGKAGDYVGGISPPAGLPLSEISSFYYQAW